MGLIYWHSIKNILSENPENDSHLWHGMTVQNPISSLDLTPVIQIYEAPAQSDQFVA